MGGERFVSGAKALLLLVGLLLARPASATAEADWADPPERPQTFEERRDAGRLSVDELRAVLPGMVAADDLPVLRVIPGVGLHLPYQFFGLHLGVELAPSESACEGASSFSSTGTFS